MGRRAFFKAGVLSLFAAGFPLTAANRSGGENPDDLEKLTTRVATLEGNLATLQGNLTTYEDNLKKQLTSSPPNVPIGTILSYAGLMDSDHPIPNGWLLCDGQSVSASDFGQLWLKLRVADGPGFRGCWGGDGNPNFNLPDLMGRFLRGVDKDRNGQPTEPARDPDRGDDKRFASNPGGNVGNNVGSLQNDALQDHSHTNIAHRHQYTDKYQNDFDGDDNHDHKYADYTETEVNPRPWTDPMTIQITNVTNLANNSVRSSLSETRVKNAYVYWIIRAK
jgi:microcystin-dependent protein